MAGESDSDLEFQMQVELQHQNAATKQVKPVDSIFNPNKVPVMTQPRHTVPQRQSVNYSFDQGSRVRVQANKDEASARIYCIVLYKLILHILFVLHED